MAKRKSIYKKRREEAHKKALKSFSSDSSSFDIGKNIENYKTRLSGAGIDPSEATDKRNWLEKKLNLPEDQNVLFDVAEIIGRPQQALLGAIKESQEGGSALEGAKAGISGEEDYYAGDILRNLGVSDKKIFTGPLSGEDRSLADILGTGLDIFADPVDLIPGGALVKAGKVAGATSDINRAKKALKAVEATEDAAKIAEATKKVDKAADVLKTVKGTKYKASLLEAGIQGAVGGTKRVVGKGLTKAAEAADLKIISKAAKEAGLIKDGTKVTKDMIPDLTRQLANNGVDLSLKTDLLNQAKKTLSRGTDYSASIADNLYDRTKLVDNEVDAAVAGSRQAMNEVKDTVTKYAEKMGKTVEQVGDDIELLISSKYNPTKNMDNLFSDIIKNEKGRSVIKSTSQNEVDNLYDSLIKFKDTHNISDNALNVAKKDGKIVVNGDKNILSTLNKNDAIRESLRNITVGNPVLKNSKINAQRRNLEKLYKRDKEFRNLVDSAEAGFSNFNKSIEGLTDGKISFKDMLRKGYTTNALTEGGDAVLDLLREHGFQFSNKYKNNDVVTIGNTKAMSGKSSSNIAKQANEDFQQDVAKQIERTDTAIAKKEGQLVENKKVALKEKRAKVMKDIEENNKAQKFIESYGDKNKATEIKKTLDRANDEIDNIITDKVAKKAEKVYDRKLANGLSNKENKFINKTNKVAELVSKLADGNLTAAETKKLKKQLDSAVESMTKARNELIVQTGKIEGAVTEKFMKETEKIANDIAKTTTESTRKAMIASEKEANELSKMKQYKASYEKIGNDLNNQLKDIEAELNTLENLSEEGIKAWDQKYIDQIADLQRKKEVLKSVQGQKLFAENFFEGFDAYVNKTASQTKALNAYNEILLESGLSNENVLKFIPKGQKAIGSDKVGKVLMDEQLKSKTIKYLDDMRNFLPDNNKSINKYINQIKNSKEVYIDKGAQELIQMTINTTKDDAGNLLKTFDSVNNFFKKTATASLGTQMRNIDGNATNMILSGIPTPSVFKQYKRGIKLSSGKYITDLLEKSTKGTLTKAEAKDFRTIKEFIKSGAMGSSKDIRDLGGLLEKATTNKESKNLLKKTWDGIFSASAKANQKFDNISRISLLDYAINNPKYVAKLGVDSPIQAMRHVLFDPQNLSPFEKKYMKRLIPFYTFTKQNLMFQMKNITKNTTKYNRLIKTFNKTYESVGEGNYRQYQKENFEIPFAIGDGTIGLKTNLPLSDLGEYFNSPKDALKRVVSSTSPIIKTPFEIATGIDTFTGREISDQSPLEQMAKFGGLQNAYRTATGIGDLATGESDNTLSSLIPSVFRYTDPEKVQNQQQYEELLAYQDYVKQLKSQGIDIPTIKELTSSTNNSLKAVRKRRTAYQKRRSS